MLTSSLVEANLLPIFKLFYLNIPFGFIACIVAIATRYSASGNNCAEEGKQAERAFYLGLQVICLVLYIPTCMIHFVILKLKGVEWCHEVWLEKPGDKDD